MNKISKLTAVALLQAFTCQAVNLDSNKIVEVLNRASESDNQPGLEQLVSIFNPDVVNITNVYNDCKESDGDDDDDKKKDDDDKKKDDDYKKKDDDDQKKIEDDKKKVLGQILNKIKKMSCQEVLESKKKTLEEFLSQFTQNIDDEIFKSILKDEVSSKTLIDTRSEKLEECSKTQCSAVKERMKESRPIVIKANDPRNSIENLVIRVNKDNSVYSEQYQLHGGLHIEKENFIVRNVIIYHQYPTHGITVSGADNVTLENVQVVMYGKNDVYTEQSPSIFVNNSKDIKIKNVQLQDSRLGLSIINSPNAKVSQVVARNTAADILKLPTFLISHSNNLELKDFHIYNNLDTVHTHEGIQVENSDNFIISNGVIDGSNDPVGACIKITSQGRKPSQGGVIENVEALRCQSCISVEKHHGLTQTKNTCAYSNFCENDKWHKNNIMNERAKKDWPIYSLWSSWNGATDIIVKDSHYHDQCVNEDNVSLNKGDFKQFGVTEQKDFTPRTPTTANLGWSDCDFALPK